MAKQMTIRERAAVKASLAMLAGNGHDAQAVINQAKQMIDAGLPEAHAYKQTLQAFGRAYPEALPGMVQASRLVEASDDATASRYDAALTALLQDDNPAPMQELGPMIARDMLALANRNGENGAAMAAALGFDSTQELVDMAGPVQFAFDPDAAPPAALDQSAASRPGDGLTSKYGPPAATRPDYGPTENQLIAAFTGSHAPYSAPRKMQPGQLVPDAA